VADRRGLHRFRTEQPPYSLLARGVERHVLPVAQRLGMGVLTWSPLASGFLTGRYRKGRALDLSSGRPTLHPDRFDPSAPRTAAKLEVVEQLVAVADEVGCSLPQLAIAFPLAHPAVTSVIIGPRTMEQLRNTLKGTSVVLDDAVLDRIDEIVPPGTDVYPPDGVWAPPSLTTPALRRRTVESRPAA
jgi:aryl-alcohol dehydrogenase-like predicted oxidoreductase